MIATLLIPLSLSLILAADFWARVPRRRATVPTGPAAGERVVAVIRPDGEVTLLLAGLGVAGLGLVLARLLMAPGAAVPLGLALGLFTVPLAAEWGGLWVRSWVLTDRRLIAGRGREVAPAEVTRLRILPLVLEVEAGRRRLRLPAWAAPVAAARAIQSAAGDVLRARDGFPRRAAAV